MNERTVRANYIVRHLANCEQLQYVAHTASVLRWTLSSRAIYASETGIALACPSVCACACACVCMSAQRQNKMLSYRRETALQGALGPIVLAKSGRLELGDVYLVDKRFEVFCTTQRRDYLVARVSRPTCEERVFYCAESYEKSIVSLLEHVSEKNVKYLVDEKEKKR